MPTAGLKQAPSLLVPEMQQRRVTTTQIAAPIPFLAPAVCCPLTIKITLTKMNVQTVSLITTLRSIEKLASPEALSISPDAALKGAS